jgi:hypothetical protein
MLQMRLSHLQYLRREIVWIRVVNEKHPRSSGRASANRLLWVLGLTAGIIVGAAAAYGLAG